MTISYVWGKMRWLTRTKKDYSPPFPGFHEYIRKLVLFVGDQGHLLPIIEIGGGLVPWPDK